MALSLSVPRRLLEKSRRVFYRRKHGDTNGERGPQHGFRCRDPKGERIVYSDPGVPYASHEYRAFIGTRSIVQGMSREDDCWDNIYICMDLPCRDR